jgi:hypothetical protein
MPRTHTRNCGTQPAYQSLITDVLQARPHLCAITFQPLSQAEWITAANPLTADIRAMFSGHGFDGGGVGPGQEIVDLAIGMAVDDFGYNVGEITRRDRRH